MPNYSVSENIAPLTFGVESTEHPIHGEKITRTIGEDGDPMLQPDVFMDIAHINILAAIRVLEGKKAKAEKKGKKDKIQEIDKEIERLNALDGTLKKRFEAIDTTALDAARKHRHQLSREVAEALSDSNRDPNNDAELLYLQRQAEIAYEAALEEYYKAGLKVLNNVNLQLVDPNGKIQNFKPIAKAVKAVRADMQRPLQENHYQVSGKSPDESPLDVVHTHTPTGWLTGEQTALYGKGDPEDPDRNILHTNPSTIRDENQVGQANAIQTDITINGKTVFSGFRHGSPSVLKIEDEPTRQHRTLMNAKQSVMLALRQKYVNMTPEERNKINAASEPLEVDVSAMSLLSPVNSKDRLDGMKQFRQVDDSRLAYWSLHQRKIDIELIGEDGQPILDKEGKAIHVKVKPNITFMTMGVNQMRTVHTQGGADLIRRVNNRGMAQLFDKFNKNHPAFLAIHEMGWPLKDIKDKINRFDRAILHQAYQELEMCNQKLHDKDPNIIDWQRRREEAVKKIEIEEGKLDQLYQELADARKAIYKPSPNMTPRLLDQLREKMNREGKGLSLEKVFVDMLEIYYEQEDIGKALWLKINKLKKQKAGMEKLLSMLPDKLKHIKLKKALLKLDQKIMDLNRQNYMFQTRFAILSHHMGDFVEWFCKSGEDRTGLVNEYVEAYCIFVEKYDRIPEWNNQEDTKLLNQILPTVHNGSPCRATNGFNDGGPGLKITSTDVGTNSINFNVDKKIAGINEKATKYMTSKRKRLGRKIKSLMGIKAKDDYMMENIKASGVAGSVPDRPPLSRSDAQPSDFSREKEQKSRTSSPSFLTGYASAHDQQPLVTDENTFENFQETLSSTIDDYNQLCADVPLKVAANITNQKIVLSATSKDKPVDITITPRGNKLQYATTKQVMGDEASLKRTLETALTLAVLSSEPGLSFEVKNPKCIDLMPKVMETLNETIGDVMAEKQIKINYPGAPEPPSKESSLSTRL